MFVFCIYIGIWVCFKKRETACIPFLYLENFIAFQTVIQELWIVCEDWKRSVPLVEMLHSGSLKIRGGTPAQEMGLGKRQFLKV